MQAHTANNPCPICDGHRALPQGTETRCWGFTADDGEYAHCTRPELAGGIQQHGKSDGYPHKLKGSCKCGQTHGEAKPVEDSTPRPYRQREIVALYEYRDEEDEILFIVERDDQKQFKARLPSGEYKIGDVRRVPYKLSEVILSVAHGYEIYIAEGEKDVHALMNAGATATCNPFGASKWKDSYSEFLRDAKVTIVADQDEAGMDHARMVCKSLDGIAKSIRVVKAATGKDASDHLAAGHSIADFVEIYSSNADPVIAAKRAVVRKSTEVRPEPIESVDHVEALRKKPSPTWPTGLAGQRTFLRTFTGVTFLVGGPSAGKSWLAIGSALEAAMAGWHVLYISAEMGPAQILRRAMGFMDGRELPDGFEVLQAGYGASVDALVEKVAITVDERRTLIVLDSISSFVDQSVEGTSGEDIHNIGPLKRLTMWAMNLRSETNGDVSFLILSEKNSKNETKGRFGDHKADLVVSLASEGAGLLKRIDVTKAWASERGHVGMFVLDPRTSTLKFEYKEES